MASYVLIDRTQLAVVHKHSDRATLTQLAWIECANDASLLPLGNPKHWADTFTPQELKQIYANGTGVNLNAYGTSLAVACHDMAMRMPASVVNEVEVHAQAMLVMDGDKHTYQYVPGAKEPKKYPPKDFTPDPIKVERNEAEEKRASTHQPNVNSTATPAGAGGTAAANPFSVPTPEPRASGQPRSGGVRDIVFKVADEVWQNAGKPTDVKQILELRKTMMNVLESEHSIKRTTSSTTLGAWQKERIS